LLSRQQQIKPRGDDREQITRARQAAEALFTSKPSPVGTRAVPESLTPTDRSTRKPRVLPILSPATPVRHEEREMSAAPEPQTVREIPPSQFARIRIWRKYGMTVAQSPRSMGQPSATSSAFSARADGVRPLVRGRCTGRHRQ
jgi:hypothetical protein